MGTSEHMQVVKELQVTSVVGQMRELLSALWTERPWVVVLCANFYFDVFHRVFVLLWCVKAALTTSPATAAR
jgi:hypothetical protein